MPHPRLLQHFPGLPGHAGTPPTRVLTILAPIHTRTIGGIPTGVIPAGTVAPAAKSTSRGMIVDVITHGPYAGRVVPRHTGRVRVEPTSAYELGGEGPR